MLGVPAVLLILAHFTSPRTLSMESDNFGYQNSRYAPAYQTHINDLGVIPSISTSQKENTQYKEEIIVPLEYTQRYAWRYQPPKRPSTTFGLRLQNSGTLTAFSSAGRSDHFQDRISQFALDLPDDFDWPEQNYKYQGPSPRIWTVDQLIEFIWLEGKNTSGIPIDIPAGGSDGEEFIPFIGSALQATLAGGGIGK